MSYAECLLLGEHFYSREEKKLENLDDLKSEVIQGQIDLQSIKLYTILAILNEFSKKILKDESLHHIEGIAFLSNWLRKSNLEKLLENNFGNANVLNQFIGKGNKRIKAQPRGLICHWIAGNVPTLTLFSLFQSLLIRNANVLRVPTQSIDSTIDLLKVFSSICIDGVYGSDLLRSVSVLHFPSSDLQMNQKMSWIADVRVVWGGLSAVEAIQGLEHREHCEDIIFGPKYSFAVMDKKSVLEGDINKIIRRFLIDVIAFEQSACSSPHVFFIECKNIKECERIAELFSKEFERLSTVQPKQTIGQLTATKIINKRAEYGLSSSKKLFLSKANDWTILIDENIQLEEPIQSRTIWIKKVNSVLEVLPLITRKIQTIGCAITDEQKFLEFTNKATFQGVARCVAPGQMNIYDSPWDGLYFLQRLVSWATITKMS